MPLSEFQKSLARLLSSNRGPDNYLAGGAAIHFEPQSVRFSDDLDYFQDSVERVASAFASDQMTLVNSGYGLTLEVSQPGYIRCVVSLKADATKIEWAHDSAWRFMPTVASEDVGFRLHPVDLAVNKVLTLAGRDEPRDFLDTMVVIRETLGLGALCWAAAGKDPGFTPRSLLELLRRRGKYRPEDFARLRLVEPLDLTRLKEQWLAALDLAQKFFQTRPPDEIGCLYYSRSGGRFVEPTAGDASVVQHHGRPGGVLPRILNA
jgi:hypothetical protein